MSDKQKIHALITNLTVNDDAFGVDPDSGDGIYIPPGVTRAAKLVAGEYREITVIPNSPDRQTHTKWMGIFVEPPVQEPRAENQEPRADDAAEQALQALNDSGSTYLSTEEVSAKMGVNQPSAHAALTTLFKQKRAARADVYFGPNSTPCFNLWAFVAEDFL